MEDKNNTQEESRSSGTAVKVWLFTQSRLEIERQYPYFQLSLTTKAWKYIHQVFA